MALTTIRQEQGVVINEGSTDVDFRVESNGNANMLFVDGGNDKVGIGTGSANAVLTTDPESGNFSSTYNNYDGVGLFIKGNGTSGNGNYGPALVFGSCDSDAVNQDHKHSAISVVQTGTDPNETGLAFWTHPSATSTDALVEKMRIDSLGRMLVGLTSASGDASAKLQARGTGASAAVFDRTTDGVVVGFKRNGGNDVGNISITSSNTAYNTSSDYRLKENVDYSWDATTRLKQLKPARFNFISDDTNTLVDGFIAHEVSSIVPEAITGAKDAVDTDGNPEYQGIDHSVLVPLLVKTIQELEARITALE